MKITKTDYVTILQYYGVKIPRTKLGRVNLSKTKKRVNTILAKKLCRCIKSVQKSKKERESIAIAICNKSIFKNRRLKHYRFTCKKRRRLRPKKGTRRYLTKTGKIWFKRTKK